MDRAFDPRPVPHHCVAVRDVLRFEPDAPGFAQRIRLFENAALFLNGTLDRADELIEAVVFIVVSDMCIRQPRGVRLLLIEHDELKRLPSNLQTAILDGGLLYARPFRLAPRLAIQSDRNTRFQERLAHGVETV